MVYHLSEAVTYLRLMGSHSNPSVVAGYLPKDQRDKMRAEVRLRKRAHDDPLVFFQEEQKRLEAERLAAKAREREAREGSVDGRSSCGSVTSSQYAVAKKEKKKDIYDMQMEIKKSKEKVEEVEVDDVLPELDQTDVAAVQRLLQSAYNAQRAFILAAEAQQQAALAADDEEARKAAAEDRRAAEAAAARRREVLSRWRHTRRSTWRRRRRRRGARGGGGRGGRGGAEARGDQGEDGGQGLLAPQQGELRRDTGHLRLWQPGLARRRRARRRGRRHRAPIEAEAEEAARQADPAEADMEGVDVEDAATACCSPGWARASPTSAACPSSPWRSRASSRRPRPTW